MLIPFHPLNNSELENTDRLDRPENPKTYPNPRVADHFNSKYWSGIDVAIYFGSSYIDEVVSIQYTVTENVMPLYGYGTYAPTFMCRGNRVIQGMFTINFVEPFYIFNILKKINLTSSPISNQKQHTEVLTSINTSITSDEFINYIKSNKDKGINPSKLQQMAQVYKDHFWSADIPSTNTNLPAFNGKNGFNIVIKYGDADFRPTSNKVGQPTPAVDYFKNTNGGSETIKDAFITSISKVIDDSGRPILEQLSFIARDIEKD